MVELVVVKLLVAPVVALILLHFQELEQVVLQIV
jgi:hypothetical protein